MKRSKHRQFVRKTKRQARRERAAAAKWRRIFERDERRDKKSREQLVIALNKFIRSHYANPATGKMGKVATAYVMACLSSAATLRALLGQAKEEGQK